MLHELTQHVMQPMISMNNPSLQAVLKINRRALLQRFGHVLETTSVTCLWVGEGFPIAISMSKHERSHPDFNCKLVIYNPVKRVIKKSGNATHAE